VNAPEANKAGIWKTSFRTHLLLQTELNYINVPCINKQPFLGSLEISTYQGTFSIMKIFKREHPVILTINNLLKTVQVADPLSLPTLNCRL
jgi:hypothetical protein